jgi:hypothetical protein
LYLSNRRLFFEWTEGIISKRFRSAGISLRDIRNVTVAHPRSGPGELIVDAGGSNNGFNSARITFGLAVNPEVWMGMINSMLEEGSSHAAEPTLIVERETTKEVVKTPCRYCGALVDLYRADKCPNCGGPLR